MATMRGCKVNKILNCPNCGGEMKPFESNGDCGGSETDGFYITHIDISTSCPLKFGSLDDIEELVALWNGLPRI